MRRRGSKEIEGIRREEVRVIRGLEGKSDTGRGKRNGSTGKRKRILMEDYISRKEGKVGGQIVKFLTFFS